MTNVDHLIKIGDDYHTRVMSIDDPETTEVAKSLAYYMAMVTAAEVDPLDSPEQQTLIMIHYQDKLENLLATYMEKVNDHL